MNWTFSNFLTLFRVAIIPLLVGLFFIEGKLINICMAFLFSFACLTDFLDGYFARSWGQITDFGRFLDPVADKLLVTSTLLMLVGVGRIEGLSLIPAVIILCREILVSGLREFLASLRVGLPGSEMAKWKTAIQMISLICLLLGNTLSMGFDHISVAHVGIVLLWSAGILTLITGYSYLKESLLYLKDQPV